MRIHRLVPKIVSVLVGLATLLPTVSDAADPVKLLQDPKIKAAMEIAKQNEPETIELQINLTENFPAPPFQEEKRAAEVKRLFESLGLENVFIDKAGNVLGTRRGAMAKPHLVVSAHMDTVFPEGTDTKVRREGTKLHAPGITDDTRGVAAMLSVIRAMNAAKLQTQGTITFVGTVGEEGLGDLRGVKQLFNETLKGQVDMFISIDGTSTEGVTNGAVGSYRYRVTYRGPGGHSWGDFGMVNPAHALGRAMAKIGDVEVPDSPKTSFSVGRIGGGTSVNSIPYEAWMEVDMRSGDVASLNVVREKIVTAFKAAADEENKRWNKGKIEVDIVQVGDRPAGGTSTDSNIVVTTQSVIRALGGTPRFSSGSTDSNYSMSLGIPSITVGAGGKSGGVHSLDEWFDTTDSWKGPQYLILLISALTN